MTKESARVVPPWIAMIFAWCAAISIWFAVAALVFILPSYEREPDPGIALRLGLWVSHLLRDSWHWIVVLLLLVAGTLFLLARTVKMARRA